MQLSVFECTATETVLNALVGRTAKIIGPKRDNLRVYRLVGRREAVVRVLGRDGYIDFSSRLLKFVSRSLQRATEHSVMKEDPRKSATSNRPGLLRRSNCCSGDASPDFFSSLLVPDRVRREHGA